MPADHLLVPRDAWDQMLAQLGNLHQAGRELAEARERAAKAETEAAFLRERLTELRASSGSGGETAAPTAEPDRPDPAAAGRHTRHRRWPWRRRR
jgi:uncharacterized membrane protein